MNAGATLPNATLKVLEEEGEPEFSTRDVCAIAKVTAPTLYHHIGSADIPTAEEAFTLLTACVAAIAGEGSLTQKVDAAPDIMWTSTKAASLLCGTASLRKLSTPTAAVLEQKRQGAFRSILKSKSNVQSQ
ncbi:TetR family transcriptional regulator [Acidiphilium cryptum]|uniref:Uncharacterized protein n=1 Tax=Acidiphilium cryptum (strain JF-5) TaxID=349163 RepID=A5FTQ5_ACICJ|nr:TetR family transcriptional regulator [Acidiphilium cryptum]ABQ28987.1 hypothetical protein Acry_3377 [Acidiphilium cryptum JF-5]